MKKVSPVRLTANAVLAGGIRPFCKTCGWRKGGPDSWDGQRCKCGHTEPPLTSQDTRFKAADGDLEVKEGER